MESKNIKISIITLSKDDNKLFKRTLISIKKQVFNFNIEWVVVDGSNNQNQLKKKKLIKTKFLSSNRENIILKYINVQKLNINGIYPCMNFGKKISRGEFIIFLNSGDEFFSKNSLTTLIEKSSFKSKEFTIIFGQAKIIAKDISWSFPSNKLTNIQNWLKFFEPNHQAMMISNELAKEYDFSTKHNLISDGLWKRKMIDNAQEIFYIKKPICKFYLDGVSSTKPKLENLKIILKNDKISFLRKLIFTIKFIFPKKLFYFYHFLQKMKSQIIDFLF